MANLASHKGKLYVTSYSGTTTTAEACSNVSGKIYQVDDAAKQLIDPTVAVVVKDNGGTVSAGDISSIDYLFGKVTFDAGYSPTTPITMDYDYLARTELTQVTSVDVNWEMESLDVSSFGQAYKEFIPGQLMSEISLEVLGTGTANIESTEDIIDFVQDGRLCCLEWQPDSDNPTTVSVHRAHGFLTGMSESATQGSAVSHSLTFQAIAVTSVEGYTVSFGFDTL